MIQKIKESLHSLSSGSKIESSKRFFKTQKGEYAEKDRFIGVSVPLVKSVAKQYFKEINLNELTELLHSDIHEERSLALFILVEKFTKTKDKLEKDEIVNFYIDEKNLKYINNWDLVDLSCYKILGEYLTTNEDKINIIYSFAKDTNFWIRRIAIVSTLAFIKKRQFNHTTAIAKILLNDNQNLIHKATGWMLREVGEKDKPELINFLNEHCKQMPRVALSYAIEKLTLEEKAFYRMK